VRWAAFLPVGLIGAALVDVVVDIILDGIGLPNVHPTTGGTIRTAVSTFAAGVTVTLFPALLSPRPWWVGVVMAGAALLWQISTLALGALFMRRLTLLFVIALGSILVYAIGAGLALLLLRRRRPAESGGWWAL
jgi:hypothetical protein